MIIIDRVFNSLENIRSNNTVAGAFVEDIQSQVWLEFCTRWLFLADYATLYHEVESFFAEKVNPIYGLKSYTREGYIIPVTFMNKDLLISPVEFNIDQPRYPDIYVEPDWNKWKETRDYATQHPNQQF